MKCTRCKRPIRTAAVTIKTLAEVRGYWPKCARLAGLLEPLQRTRAPVFSRPVEADAAQMVLELIA